MRSLLVVVAIALAACGAGQHPEASEPPCPAVAAHVAELANRDNDGQLDDATREGIRAESERQCRDDRWSQERRRCLLASATNEAALRCPRK